MRLNPFLFLLALAAFTHAAKERISILDFEPRRSAGRSVSRESARALSGRFLNVAMTVLDSSRFEPLTSGNFKDLLSEEVLQECVGFDEVENARKLGARWYVVGELSRSARGLVLYIRLYDVENGRLLADSRMEGAGVQALSREVDSKARALLSKIPEPVANDPH